MIEVKNLAEVPYLNSVVAFWTFQEWGKTIGRNFYQQLHVFMKRQNLNNFPMCFVALKDGCPVGTVSLVENDNLDGYEIYSPWIASLYVVQGYRSQGIAQKLLEEALIVARNLGLHKVYLHTPNAKAYYLKLGWMEKDTTICKLGPTDIMYKEL